MKKEIIFMLQILRRRFMDKGKKLVIVKSLLLVSHCDVAKILSVI